MPSDIDVIADFSIGPVISPTITQEFENTFHLIMRDASVEMKLCSDREDVAGMKFVLRTCIENLERLHSRI